MESYNELKEALGAMHLRIARRGLSPVLMQECRRLAAEIKAMEAQIRTSTSPTDNYPKC